NLALSWASDPEVAHATTKELNANVISIDPLRWRALQPFCARSAAVLQLLLKQPNHPFELNTVLLTALNNRLNTEPGPHGAPLLGKPSLGVVFFESEDLGQSPQQNAARYACILAGSSWNAEVLRAHGIPRVETVLQGIDATLFHPAPRRRLFPDRFLVFSGGKLEPRKGQDLVMAAWRIFAARHPDAILMTAWHNPWPATSRGIDAVGHTAPLPLTKDGIPDVEGWAAANGIKPEQFYNLGFVPNAFMPTILREADAAVFPNRCEGGTNLVAMETMACGVPTILSANTGHLDLLQDGAALALTDQRPIPALPGWRESNVEEIVAALETLYTDRTRAATIGAAGAKLLSRMTWAKTAAEMKRIITAV
ncbi:MAG: glycosyltransferase family 4 protein, partial [Roseomonas sp.]|nr:glycosyltransferase family 4 protein [Roseomonas sp.]